MVRQRQHVSTNRIRRCHHQRMVPNGGGTANAAEDGAEMAEKVEREELVV
ncbi:hypothetical protein SESBI_45419 [Sesbania bispinosa]|nr:hypothetical protein SESBI_45419 [Sesbania bispinosa]